MSVATRMFSARSDRARPVGRAFGWADVLRPLVSDDARSVAVSHYRAAGFGPDDLPRLRGAREAAVEALIRAEDWLECEHPGRRREREALRVARRRLECEAWP